MKNLRNISWMIAGFILGTLTFSVGFAAVPKKTDSGLYQEMSEIRGQKQKDLTFDSDVARLASAEDSYRENLPSLSDHPRIKNPVSRVSQQKYRYTQKVKAARR